jgi:hypothetical protein
MTLRHQHAFAACRRDTFAAQLKMLFRVARPVLGAMAS